MVYQKVVLIKNKSSDFFIFIFLFDNFKDRKENNSILILFVNESK